MPPPPIDRHVCDLLKRVARDGFGAAQDFADAVEGTAGGAAALFDELAPLTIGRPRAETAAAAALLVVRQMQEIPDERVRELAFAGWVAFAGALLLSWPQAPDGP